MMTQDTPTPADPEVAYEAWIRTIPGDFDMPHISQAFAAGYAAGQTLASASAAEESIWNKAIRAAMHVIDGEYNSRSMQRDHAKKGGLRKEYRDFETMAMAIAYAQSRGAVAHLLNKEPNHD